MAFGSLAFSLGLQKDVVSMKVYILKWMPDYGPRKKYKLPVFIPAVFLSQLAAERYAIYIQKRFKRKMDISFKETTVLDANDVAQLLDVSISQHDTEPELWKRCDSEARP